MGNKSSKHKKHSHSSEETSPRRSPVEQAAEIYSTPQVQPVGHPPGQVLQLQPSTTSLGTPIVSDQPITQETTVILTQQERRDDSHHEMFDSQKDQEASNDHSHSRTSSEHPHSKSSSEYQHSKSSSAAHTHRKPSAERIHHESNSEDRSHSQKEALVPQIPPPLPNSGISGTPPSSSPKSTGSPRISPENELSAGSYENLENLRILSESQSYNGKGTIQNPTYNGFGGQQIRIVVIGEANSGKTSLIERYSKRKFVDDVKAPVVEQFVKLINQPSEEAPLEVTIIDTANTQIHSKVRSFGYETADVFIVCFSLADPTSIIQLRTKWIPELIIEGKIVTRNVPFLLVGCKSDQRVQEPNFLPEKILQFAHHIKAAKYLECSAKTDENCIQVIHEAISLCTEHEFEDE